MPAPTLQHMSPDDVARHSLDHAAWLVELLRTRIEERRGQLGTVAITSKEVGAAQALAVDLLHTAAKLEYGSVTPKNRQRALTAAFALRRI